MDFSFPQFGKYFALIVFKMLFMCEMSFFPFHVTSSKIWCSMDPRERHAFHSYIFLEVSMLLIGCTCFSTLSSTPVAYFPFVLFIDEAFLLALLLFD